jgi:hypothetical protein
MTLKLTLQTNGTVGATLVQSGGQALAVLERISKPDGFWAERDGVFACLLKATESSDAVPAGAGWARLKMKADGRFSLAGKLADGTPLVQSGYAGADGKITTFLLLPRGRGKLAIEASVPDQPVPVWNGTAEWHGAANRGNYPLGFDTELELIGERAASLGKDREVLTGSTSDLAAELILVDPAADSVRIPLTLRPGGKVAVSTPNTLRARVGRAADGGFKGSLKYPATGRPISFSGMILPSQREGTGFFLDQGKSRVVRLVPTTPAD